MSIPAQKIVVEPSGGRVISFLGFRGIVKVDGAQTAGAFSVMEAAYPPGNFTPPHRHDQHDEVGYILDGELGVMVGEEDFVLGTGSFFIRPRGVPHALWNNTSRPVKFLDTFTPAGLEAWFDELARLTCTTPPATMQQIFEAGWRFDTIFMPELAPPLIQKYGLRLPGS